MRTTTFAFLFSLLLTTLSNAQEIGHIGFGGPQTRVVVLNAADDNALIWVQIGEKASKRPIARGEQWGRGYTYGMTGSVAVNVTVCATHETIRNAIVWPPEWTKDEVFGANALTEAFLRSDPSEKDVQRHVEGIEKSLNGRLGRKEKIAELRAWFRTVKQSGVAPTVTGCRNPQIITSVQDVSQWGNERTISIVVRGEQQGGYHEDVRQ